MSETISQAPPLDQTQRAPADAADRRVSAAEPTPEITVAVELPQPPLSSSAQADATDIGGDQHKWPSRFDGGHSSTAVGQSFEDWAVYAADAPFKAASLGRSAMAQWFRLGHAAYCGAPAIVAKPSDHRFPVSAWSKYPYHLVAQGVLLGEEWWNNMVVYRDGPTETSPL